jgi:hypothetical protein
MKGWYLQPAAAPLMCAAYVLSYIVSASSAFRRVLHGLVKLLVVFNDGKQVIIDRLGNTSYSALVAVAASQTNAPLKELSGRPPLLFLGQGLLCCTWFCLLLLRKFQWQSAHWPPT